MRKRKKIINLKIILTFLITFTIITYALFSKFEKVVIQPITYESYLKNYFIRKSLWQIYFSINEIMRVFPEIKEIELNKNIFNKTLVVRLTISQNIAIICDQHKCLYLDNSGQIIKPTIIDKKKLVRISSSLNIEESSLLHPQLREFLIYLFEYANFSSLILREIKIYPNFDLGVIDLQNREFLFDPSKNLEEQFKKFHLILENEKIIGSRFDLRISKKIYYR
ncbi:MAG: hypothetical protein NZ822_00135 [Patescibacteria group bacterium]|nr:hypothetical protein [Patescibacteria group bacterium]